MTDHHLMVAVALSTVGVGEGTRSDEDIRFTAGKGPARQRGIPQ